MSKLLKKLTTRVPPVIGNAASVAGLLATCAASGSTGPFLLVGFILASVGAIAYESYLELESEKDEAKIQEKLLDLLKSSEGLEKALQRMNTGAFLATDRIANLEKLDVADLPLNAPVRPFLIVYRFLTKQNDEMREAFDELQQTYEQNWQLLERSLQLIDDKSDHLHRWLGCDDVGGLKDYVDEIEEFIQLRFDRLNGSIATCMGKLQSDVDGLKERIDSFNTPPLSLTVHTYDAGTLDSSRFHYQVERLEFVGREEELSKVEEFLTPTGDPIDIQWWLWTGAGGVGKSKLAQQSCMLARLKGYRAGFLRIDAGEFDRFRFDQWHVKIPTLIVVDYVANKAAAVRKAIAAFVENPAIVKAPLRVLLLERKADEFDHWLSEFGGGAGGDRIHIAKTKYSGHSNPLAVSQLSAESLRTIVKSILDEFSYGAN